MDQRKQEEIEDYVQYLEDENEKKRVEMVKLQKRHQETKRELETAHKEADIWESKYRQLEKQRLADEEERSKEKKKHEELKEKYKKLMKELKKEKSSKNFWDSQGAVLLRGNNGPPRQTLPPIEQQSLVQQKKTARKVPASVPVPASKGKNKKEVPSNNFWEGKGTVLLRGKVPPRQVTSQRSPPLAPVTTSKGKVKQTSTNNFWDIPAPAPKVNVKKKKKEKDDESSSTLQNKKTECEQVPRFVSKIPRYPQALPRLSAGTTAGVSPSPPKQDRQRPTPTFRRGGRMREMSRDESERSARGCDEWSERRTPRSERSELGTARSCDERSERRTPKSERSRDRDVTPRSSFGDEDESKPGVWFVRF